jgi:hypothetical protein
MVQTYMDSGMGNTNPRWHDISPYLKNVDEPAAQLTGPHVPAIDAEVHKLWRQARGLLPVHVATRVCQRLRPSEYMHTQEQGKRRTLLACATHGDARS